MKPRSVHRAIFFGCVLMAAPQAWAEGQWPAHGDQRPMPAEIVAPDAPAEAVPAVPAGGHGATHPIGLHPEAINWFNFSYKDGEEEYVAEHHVKPGPPVVALLVNFILLLTIIVLLARKPLASFLQSRSDSVREGLAEATKMLDEANERLADYSARLERMDEEMTRLREEFIAAGEAERDRLVAEAGARAERMRRDAETRMAQEFSQLREELRLEAIAKAVEASTALLKTNVTSADQRRLADEYLTQLDEQGVGQ